MSNMKQLKQLKEHVEMIDTYKKTAGNHHKIEIDILKETWIEVGV